MLISKTAKVKWHYNNKKHYEEKGYIFTHIGDEFNVNLEDCIKNSEAEVILLCDYCSREGISTTIKKPYRRYLTEDVSSIVKLHACCDCCNLKAKDVAVEKQRQGLLTKKDSYYWYFYENRLKELKDIINTGFDISNIFKREFNPQFVDMMHRYKDNIVDMIHDLGYKVYEVCSNTDHICSHFTIEHLVFYIEQFISKHNYFPTTFEILESFHINYNTIFKFGGIDNIRKFMGLKIDHDPKLLFDFAYNISDLTKYINKSGIYKITNIKNGKIYIGQSENLWNRIRKGYVSKLPQGKNHNRHLQRAWDKYGADNFTIDIIEECEINKLNEREQYWIDYYKSYDNRYGYNICKEAGSCRGRKDTQEMIERKRKIGLENNPMKGKNHTKEVKELISKKRSIPIIQLSMEGMYIKEWESTKSAAEGLNLSPTNISSVVNKKTLSCGGFIFCKKSEYDDGSFNVENIINKKRHHHLAKKALQFDLDGNFIGEWLSVSEASRKLNINKSTLDAAISGRLKSAGGFYMEIQIINYAQIERK